MVIFNRLLPIVSLIIMMAVCVYPAEDTITVITYSHKYEKVTYRIDPPNQQLILIQQDSETFINFDDIRYIYNTTGKDITKIVFREKCVQTEPDSTRILEINESILIEGSTAKSKSTNPMIAIKIGTNYGVAAGKYYSGYESGFGFEGDFNILFRDGNLITLSMGRPGIKPPSHNAYESNSTYTMIKQKYSFSFTRYMISVGSWRNSPGNNGKSSIIYGYLGFGVLRKASSNKYSRRNVETGVIESYNYQYSRLRYFIAVGVNGVIPIGSNIGIDLGGGYNLVLLRDSDTSDRSGMAHIFEFKIGIYIPINPDN